MTSTLKPPPLPHEPFEQRVVRQLERIETIVRDTRADAVVTERLRLSVVANILKDIAALADSGLVVAGGDDPCLRGIRDKARDAIELARGETS